MKWQSFSEKLKKMLVTAPHANDATSDCADKWDGQLTREKSEIVSRAMKGETRFRAEDNRSSSTTPNYECPVIQSLQIHSWGF